MNKTLHIAEHKLKNPISLAISDRMYNQKHIYAERYGEFALYHAQLAGDASNQWRSTYTVGHISSGLMVISFLTGITRLRKLMNEIQTKAATDNVELSSELNEAPPREILDWIRDNVYLPLKEYQR